MTITLPRSSTELTLHVKARHIDNLKHRDTRFMTRKAQIELRDLEIAVAIGTYGPDDVVPDAHILDLTLGIAPDLVQIGTDNMALVFDYDPLIAQIDRIARSRHFETQEYLMTQIVEACAGYRQITELDICLKKQPVLGNSGALGVRLTLDSTQLAALRSC